MVHFILSFMILGIFNAGCVGACTIDIFGYGDQFSQNDQGQQPSPISNEEPRINEPLYLVKGCTQPSAYYSDDTQQSAGLDGYLGFGKCFFNTPGEGADSGNSGNNDENNGASDSLDTSIFSDTQNSLYGINDNGNIESSNYNTDQGGVVMLPDMPAQAVPVPASVVLLASGLGAISIFKKVKKFNVSK